MSSYNAEERRHLLQSLWIFGAIGFSPSSPFSAHLQFAIAEIAPPAKWSKGAAWAVQHFPSIRIRCICGNLWSMKQCIIACDTSCSAECTARRKRQYVFSTNHAWRLSMHKLPKKQLSKRDQADQASCSQWCCRWTPLRVVQSKTRRTERLHPRPFWQTWTVSEIKTYEDK